MTKIKSTSTIENKSGINKVAAKGDAKQAILDSKEALSDDSLLQALSDLEIEKHIDKATKNRNIWKPEMLKQYNSDKTARRILRNNFQVPLSDAICKATDKVEIKFKSQKLFDFYKLTLININKYSSLSETSKNYINVHKAFSIMKKEMDF